MSGKPAVVYPLGKAKRVAIDSQHNFGQARDGPTGKPTWVLYEMAQGDSTIAQVAYWHNVPIEAVRCAIEFETRKRKEPALRDFEEQAMREAEAYWEAKQCTASQPRYTD